MQYNNKRKRKPVARMSKRKRRRRRIIRRRIIFAVAVLSIVAIVILVIRPRYAKSSMIEKNTENVADQGQVENATIEDNSQKISKKINLVRSASYKEITDDSIKSPYMVLLDADNDTVIAGRECDAKIYPASMTKVMSLIVAVENKPDLSGSYTFQFEMLNRLYIEQASVAGFLENETVPYMDLLYAMVLPSGADGAEAIAQIVAGSNEKFADMMNEKCNELGLKNTHFTNPTGLYDDNQYTTASEMAAIMKYAMTNPVCAKVLSTYQYTTTKTDQHPEGIMLTSNMFSRMYGNEVEGVLITAGKTGYTDEARSCLVSYAEKDGKHYACVTAHSASKWECVFNTFDIYRNYLP